MLCVFSRSAPWASLLGVLSRLTFASMAFGGVVAERQLSWLLCGSIHCGVSVDNLGGRGGVANVSSRISSRCDKSFIIDSTSSLVVSRCLGTLAGRIGELSADRVAHIPSAGAELNSFFSSSFCLHI